MEQKAHYLGLAAEHRWWLSFAHDDTVFAAMVKNDRGRIVLGDTVPVSERLFQSFQAKVQHCVIVDADRA